MAKSTKGLNISTKALIRALRAHEPVTPQEDVAEIESNVNDALNILSTKGYLGAAVSRITHVVVTSAIDTPVSLRVTPSRDAIMQVSPDILGLSREVIMAALVRELLSSIYGHVWNLAGAATSRLRQKYGEELKRAQDMVANDTAINIVTGSQATATIPEVEEIQSNLGNLGSESTTDLYKQYADACSQLGRQSHTYQELINDAQLLVNELVTVKDLLPPPPPSAQQNGDDSGDDSQGSDGPGGGSGGGGGGNSSGNGNGGNGGGSGSDSGDDDGTGGGGGGDTSNDGGNGNGDSDGGGDGQDDDGSGQNGDDNGSGDKDDDGSDQQDDDGNGGGQDDNKDDDGSDEGDDGNDGGSDEEEDDNGSSDSPEEDLARQMLEDMADAARNSSEDSKANRDMERILGDLMKNDKVSQSYGNNAADYERAQTENTVTTFFQQIVGSWIAGVAQPDEEPEYNPIVEFVPALNDRLFPEGDVDRSLLVVAVDTSGSMTTEFLEFIAKMVGTDENMDIVYLYFDAECTHFEAGDTMGGGGGTNFASVENWIQRHRNDPMLAGRYPDGVLMYTDGYAPVIEPEFPDKWFWLITPDGSTWPEDEGMKCYGMTYEEMRSI